MILYILIIPITLLKMGRSKPTWSNRRIIPDGSSLDKDDFSSVTERRIKSIRNTHSFPLGLPEVVEEKYLNSGQERLLKRWVNRYNSQGKLESQAHYNEDGNYLYTLTWKYNVRGQIIEETNSLGQATQRIYDE